jgi:hypothetical protein
MIFSSPAPDHGYMEEWMNNLRNLIAKRDDVAILSHLAEVAPEYQPSGKWEAAMRRMTLRAAAGD